MRSSQDVIKELRGNYEERMTELTSQLTQRDDRIHQLEQQLHAALQPPQPTRIQPRPPLPHQPSATTLVEHQGQPQPAHEQQEVADHPHHQQQPPHQQLLGEKEGSFHEGKENRQASGRNRRATRRTSRQVTEEQQQQQQQPVLREVGNVNDTVRSVGY